MDRGHSQPRRFRRPSRDAAYTHLQPAEPVLVAHWLLAYAEMFFRDSTRLADCRKRANFCPLGSGAVAGATLTLNRQRIATELHFDAPTANSLDATSDRDFILEFVQALEQVALHLSRWAEEMILFSTTAYGFVELPEAYSTVTAQCRRKKSRPAGTGKRQVRKSREDAPPHYELVKGLPRLQQRFTGTPEPIFNATDTILTMPRS